ncbi:MAG: hypothetical protein VX738_11645 [Planctomycetota bacterium]|nr:hypothetical protein [Planctomycetota bacterium]
MFFGLGKIRVLLATSFAMAIVVTLCICVPSVSAQTLSFSPAQNPLLDDVQVEIQVTGHVEVKSARAGVVQQSVAVTGRLEYAQWLAYTEGTDLCRSIRKYAVIDRDIKIGGTSIDGSYREDRRLVVDQMYLDEHLIYSPQGSLTRDELDMIHIQWSPATLHRLLPSEPVTLKSTWTLENPALTALLVLDAVSSNTVTGRITSLTQDRAKLSIQGKVLGGANGVLTEIELNLQAEYDLKGHRFMMVRSAMTEKREIGHAQPGLDVTARINIQLQPITRLSTIPAAVIERCNQPMSAGGDHLLLRPSGVPVDLQVDRNWHVLVDQPELFVMRQVERGELVAQCSLLPLPEPTRGENMTLVRFQNQIQSSLGEQFHRFVHSQEKPLPSGGILFRVVTQGEVDEIPLQWIYYYVTDPDGLGSAFVFTVALDKVEHFADQDRELIATLQFRRDPKITPISTLTTAKSEEQK